MKAKCIACHIKGIAPLIMNSDTALDPFNDRVREMKKIWLVKDNKRTDEQRERLLRLDWEVSIYHDNIIGPYVPSKWLEQMMVKAGCAQKKGQEVKIGVSCDELRYPLVYQGPRELEELWDGGFRNVCTVPTKTGSRTLLCKPIFNQWEVKFNVIIDPEMIGESNLEEILMEGGKKKGLGSHRPKYGRFEVVTLIAS